MNFRLLQAQLLSPKVHRVELDGMDKKLNNLIFVVLLQLKQQPIGISTKGFFNIDFGLLAVVRMCNILERFYGILIFMNYDFVDVGYQFKLRNNFGTI